MLLYRFYLFINFIWKKLALISTFMRKIKIDDLKKKFKLIPARNFLDNFYYLKFYHLTSQKYFFLFHQT